MNYQCKNCGAPMVFEPESKSMQCPSCGGSNCENQKSDDVFTNCSACGGQIDPGQYDLTNQCPYCGNYLIYNQRIIEKYEPNKIIPFKLNKDMAVKTLKNNLKKAKLAPNSFLSEHTLVELKGYYVPFFMYDCKIKAKYECQGQKKRTWRSGDYVYTEVSRYDVTRVMNAEYINVPADASDQMNDEIMDIMEPYDYEELEDFDPKYLSGFYGEIYNHPYDTYLSRVETKMKKSANTIIMESIKGYDKIVNQSEDYKYNYGETEYALFPVWKYDFNYQGKDYTYFVNGQTGKVYGDVPVSTPKIIIYGAGCGIIWFAIIEAVLFLLRVWGF